MKLRYWFLIPIICFAGYRLLEAAKDSLLPLAFIFDPKDLHSLSQQAIEENPDGTPNDVFESLHAKLKAKYGDYINELNYEDWMFNNAGGAMVRKN